MLDVKRMIWEINRAVSEDAFDLNDWETEFVESIGKQLEAGRALSDKQDEVLERIWRKATV